MLEITARAHQDCCIPTVVLVLDGQEITLPAPDAVRLIEAVQRALGELVVLVLDEDRERGQRGLS